MNAVQVVPGDAEPVFEMIVAPVAVVPMTKQMGCAVALGQTIWVSDLVAGIVSNVHVTVEPEIVPVSTTPLDEVPQPMAIQAGVVALVGHAMLVSCETPAGSVLVVQLVPSVETAAAPPDEL